MKQFITCFLLSLSLFTSAQRECGTMHHQQMIEQQDPKIIQRRLDIENFAAQYLANNPNYANSRAVITIPVVVHVVWNTAAQNISDAQIQSQLTAMNKDFIKQNADTSKVPAVWKSLIANCNIQFCLAVRDPNGNTTTGIERIQTSTTSFIDDDKVKYTAQGGANAWPAASYLNLWVCNLGNSLLGYAQFPGGPAATDGVVITYKGFGTTGTAAAPYNLGRTVTHEVGHWLNLYHIWGDDNGACTGSDQVGDTPNQANATYGTSTYPKTDACATSSPGIMFMNYMDYSDDAYMYMFTNGQNGRISPLFVSGGSRFSLVSSLGCTPVGNVQPTALFTGTPLSICPGGTVNFTSQSTGSPTSYAWTFQGGTPATSTAAAPSVVYNTAGTYNVTLTVTNANGTNTLTKTAYVNVLSAAALPLVEGFENATFPPTNWTIGNPDGLDAWKRTTSAGGFGASTASALFDNYTNDYSGQKDYLYTPSYDFTNVANGRIKWDYAYTYYTNPAGYDSLQVLYSIDCGATWVNLWKKGGVSLATATSTTAQFVPTSTQWKKDSVSLSALSGKSNVRFAFINTTDYGNSMFLDNINIYNATNSCSNPVADFTAAPTTVTVGSSVSFTDLSTNSPISWAWTFTGGTPTSSTSQNPSVTYNTAGTYAVTLTATNTCGASTATTKTAYITVVAAGGPSTCDTLTNFISNDTLSIYKTAYGYISGNNNLGHTGFADKFTTALTGAQVTGVFLGFGAAKVLTAGKTATVCVWDGTGGTPGATPLASNTVLYSAIKTAVTNGQEVFVSFPTPPTVSATFFVGIQVTNSSGDTIALITSQLSNSGQHTNQGWYKSGNTWSSYSALYTYNFTHYISPVLCTAGATVTKPVAAFTANKTSTCAGTTITFTDQSTNTPTSWAWTFTGGTPAASSAQSPTINYSTAGTYPVKLVVYNAGGKDSLIKTGYIVVNPNPTLTTTTIADSCYGGSTGSATAAAANGTPNYTYAWTGNLTGATISGKPAGSYGVTVTDSKGCTATATADIQQPISALALTVGKTDAYCGKSNGTVTAAASGGSGGFTYLWSPGGATTATVNNLAANTYAVTVTDAKGCKINGSATVLATANTLTITISKSDASCGLSNGTANAIPSGSGNGATYIWNRGDTTGSIGGLAVGLYKVTVTNASGCTASASVNISNTAAPVVTVTKANVTCNGLNNGTASANVSGGGTYTITWSNNQTGTSISNLAPGNYSVTASNGTCQATDTFSISQPAALTVSVTHTDNTCTQNNGTATATSTGGNGGNTFAWSPSGTGGTITNLAPNTYTVTVTDSKGCKAQGSTTVVTLPNTLTVVATKTDATCGKNNGTVTATPAGGNGGNTFAWSPGGGSSATVLNLAPNTYSVTVTDNKGCTAQGSATVGATPNTLTVSVSKTDANCGQNNGTATATLSGSAVGAIYAWSNTAQTTNPITGLSVGTYQVTVTNSGGCTASASATISNVNGPNFALTKTDITCAGLSNGTASVTISGSGTYTTTWSTIQSGNSIGGLADGNYSVTVSDGTCQTIQQFVITIPTALVTTSTVVNATQGANGSSTVHASGGIPPYSFLWSNGQTDSTAAGLAAGTYTCTVQDANHCTSAKTVTITSTGIEQITEIAHIDLLPNPANDFVQLDVQFIKSIGFNYSVYDAIGRTILVSEQFVAKDYSSKIELNGLNAGIYFLQLTTYSDKQTFKFIKQ